MREGSTASSRAKKTSAKGAGAESRASAGKKSAGKKSSRAQNDRTADITQMRVLAHDLSNALEAILQASYLLGQSKLGEDPQRWAKLIESSSQQAARLNREIRQLLRALSDESEIH